MHGKDNKEFLREQRLQWFGDIGRIDEQSAPVKANPKKDEKRL